MNSSMAHTLASGNTVMVLGEGRLINSAAAHGHPASVMDAGLCQALCGLATEWALKQKGKLQPKRLQRPRGDRRLGRQVETAIDGRGH